MSKLSWRQLNDVLCNMNEADVWGMLEEERFGEKRASVLQRSHQRYNVLRVSVSYTHLTLPTKRIV